MGGRAKDGGMLTRTSVCETQLRQALGKSELADVELHVHGVWVASGHRSVLSARSAVFASIFAHDTEERRSGVVKLNDVTSGGLAAFLEFMYLGNGCHACFIPARLSITILFFLRVSVLWSCMHAILMTEEAHKHRSPCCFP